MPKQDPKKGLNKARIAGLRKWWKQWYDKAKRFDVDRNGQGFEHFTAQAERSKALLTEGIKRIEALQKETTYRFGFWFDDNTPAKERTIFQKWATKLSEHADEAIDLLVDARYLVQNWVEMSDPQRKGSPLYRDDIWTDYAGRGLNSIVMPVREAAKAADSEISGKFMRLLTTIVREETLDPIGADDTVTLGKLKIVFLDTHEGGGRNPRRREEYISLFKEAQALLARASLAHVWYGHVYVKPEDAAPGNSMGVQWGVGATYHTRKDFITVYNNPVRNLPHLLIHELGHRYYYKFMRPKDRARFSSFFNIKKVGFKDGNVLVQLAYNPDLIKDLGKIAVFTQKVSEGTDFLYEYAVPVKQWKDLQRNTTLRCLRLTTAPIALAKILRRFSRIT